MSQGKYVLCRSGAGDGEEVYQEVERIICLLELRPGCPTCPHAQFEALFPTGVGLQTVACPRWENEDAQLKRRDPVGYVLTSRTTCLVDKPFTFCVECPNGKPEQLPRTALKWFETEERQRKIELELDEELDE